jgi:hypothetical protein
LRKPVSLTAAALEFWLLGQGLAERDGDLLRPTKRGIEVGIALAFLGDG